MKKEGSIRTARIADNIVTYLILIVISLIFLFPCVWLIAASFSKSGDIHSFSGFFPEEFSVQTFVDLFTDDVNGLYPYGRWFLNTLYVATMTYIIMGQLNLLNSLESLIFYYSCTAPLGYLVQKGYFDSIPYTIHEAATIDGANQLQIFTKITLPLSKPMLVYTALTQFAWPWSDCLLPKLLLKEREMWTVAVGLYSMPDTQFARFAAGSVFIAVPIVILYFCLVKNIVSGLTAGAVKG